MITNHDSQLVSEIKKMIQDENRLLAGLLSRIAEIDERRVYAGLGFSSTFTFLTGELHLSEGAAYKRIMAARTARRFPLILDMVAKGEIHLSAIAILAPILTDENHREVLEAAVHKSKRDIERLHALHLPKPDVPDLVRRLPEPPTIPGDSCTSEQLLNPESLPVATHSEPLSSAARRDRTVQISEARVKFQFTGTEELRSKLERARALLRHKHPEGRLEDIFDEALEALLEKKDPDRKLARSEKRRTKHASEKNEVTSSSSRSGVIRDPVNSRDSCFRRNDSWCRRIPQHVKDIVWKRDGGRCQYMSPDGRRCEERGMLEFHHIHAWASGGSSDDPANIVLACRAHNQYLAREEFGDRANHPPRRGYTQQSQPRARPLRKRSVASGRVLGETGPVALCFAVENCGVANAAKGRISTNL